MKVLAAMLLSAMLATSAWAGENTSGKFAWVPFKDALAKAQATDKMIMVDIYTDW